MSSGMPCTGQASVTPRSASHFVFGKIACVTARPVPAALGGSSDK
jgi:hypothetical protein